MLIFEEGPISRAATNYLGLASLTEYFRFITDSDGALRRYLFESNVRDYMDRNPVNLAIDSGIRRLGLALGPYSEHQYANLFRFLYAQLYASARTGYECSDSTLISLASDSIDDELLLTVHSLVSERWESGGCKLHRNYDFQQPLIERAIKLNLDD